MTPNQSQALDFVRERITKAGFAPTLKEIAEQVGVSEPGARRIVEALAAQGYLQRKPGMTRGIELPGSDLRVVDSAALCAELKRRGEWPVAERRGASDGGDCGAFGCRDAAVHDGFCGHHWGLIPPGVLRSLQERARWLHEEPTIASRRAYMQVYQMVRDMLHSTWRR
ncbi:LexA family protein [Sphingomonas hengshuiensis]|uniref:LexA repressor DNA-binding domain-containing protein n=1 Tax=Sphingomonas hengshuiensis TaxID=1609977 RepID=A0A7U4JAB5_9SPHN|nr:helix-turn-helix domain-containing protein [Sphingomonas hengshuiensis]AJP73143.1 hypothetical protein TS85_17110 [Sphingomonas hengshuiensis]